LPQLKLTQLIHFASLQAGEFLTAGTVVIYPNGPGKWTKQGSFGLSADGDPLYACVLLQTTCFSYVRTNFACITPPAQLESENIADAMASSCCWTWTHGICQLIIIPATPN
jgi:hypothetical protein